MKKKTTRAHTQRKAAWLPILLALAALLAWAGPGQALPNGPTNIDPFDRAQCAGPNCAPAEPVVAGLTILGGERDVLAQPLSGSSALRVWGESWPMLTVENDPEAGRSTYLLVWDGADGDETAIAYDGLDADLLAGCTPGSAHFTLHQTYLDRRAAYSLTIYSGPDDWSTWHSGIVDQAQMLFQVPLDEFAVGAGSGADWHDVGAIALFIDTSIEPTTDLSLASFAFDCTPTAIELARFEATVQDNAVHLVWETAAEIDNLGFALYRAGSPAGPGTEITPALIPARTPGSLEGHVYTWTDEQVRPGATYTYWLADVDIYGLTTLHGPLPVSLPAGAPLRRLVPARPRLRTNLPTPARLFQSQP